MFLQVNTELKASVQSIDGGKLLCCTGLWLELPCTAIQKKQEMCGFVSWGPKGRISTQSEGPDLWYVLFILRSLVLHGPSTQANVDKFGMGRCRVYGKEASTKHPVSRKEIGIWGRKKGPDNLRASKPCEVCEPCEACEPSENINF